MAERELGSDRRRSEADGETDLSEAPMAAAASSGEEVVNTNALINRLIIVFT